MDLDTSMNGDINEIPSRPDVQDELGMSTREATGHTSHSGGTKLRGKSEHEYAPETDGFGCKLNRAGNAGEK